MSWYWEELALLWTEAEDLGEGRLRFRTQSTMLEDSLLDTGSRLSQKYSQLSLLCVLRPHFRLANAMCANIADTKSNLSLYSARTFGLRQVIELPHVTAYPPTLRTTDLFLSVLDRNAESSISSRILFLAPFLQHTIATNRRHDLESAFGSRCTIGCHCHPIRRRA